MFPTDTPFLFLDDARTVGAAPARLYRDPVEILVAERPDELEPLLERAAHAGRDGLHVAGYLSYEAGLALEPRLAPLVPDRLSMPLAWFGLFRGYEEIGPDDIAGRLPIPARTSPDFAPLISRDEYRAGVTRSLDYIRAGDVYQVNYSFEMQAEWNEDPAALYSTLRPQAGAGYGALLFDGSNWLLSFSPELFFTLQDDRITARPMKGTAARSVDPAADEQIARLMRADPKQRAENLMIVDLLRNDLSRVARPGSVRVPKLFEVESYPTIHQMTSTVSARLDPRRSVADLIRAIYPCGSITGAPKIRAMEIIAELEGRERGIYCGSIGRIDPCGDAAFNVAIRTFLRRGGENTLSLGLGSAIVADSKVEDEWAECLAKGEFARNG